MTIICKCYIYTMSFFRTRSSHGYVVAIVVVSDSDCIGDSRTNSRTVLTTRTLRPQIMEHKLCFTFFTLIRRNSISCCVRWFLLVPQARSALWWVLFPLVLITFPFNSVIFLEKVHSFDGRSLSADASVDHFANVPIHRASRLKTTSVT